MPSNTNRPRLIDADRLWDRLMVLAQIGATPDGGVDRQALSTGEIEAWRQLLAWGEAAGLTPSTDPAGNLFLTLPGCDRAAPPILVGSHIDTQPTGGRFDGVLGVLAALEAVATMAQDGDHPAQDVIVVAWMNEEGCRFAPGMMGSEAFAGLRSLDAIRAVRDADDLSVGAGVDRLHAAFPELPQGPLGFRPARYLELHIEQGPVLEQEGCVIGIVTGIQGKKTFEITITGREGHAGTLPMTERQDALATFTAIASALYETVGGHDHVVKFTIGRLRVEPNAPSVVPARVTFSIDLRHPDNAVLAVLASRIDEICRAQVSPSSVALRALVDAPSNAFDERLQQLISEVASELGHPAMPILSAAGHDARHLAGLCPSAMIFIPCRGGISHAPDEWAEPAHVAAGAEVLAWVLQHLASAGPTPAH